MQTSCHLVDAAPFNLLQHTHFWKNKEKKKDQLTFEAPIEEYQPFALTHKCISFVINSFPQ